MRSRNVLVSVVGLSVLGLVGIAAPASAVGEPTVSDVTVTSVNPAPAGEVDLAALGDASVTITADIVPADNTLTIASATVSLAATVVRPEPDFANTIPVQPAPPASPVPPIDMTSSDGEHFTATVDIPRDASPGAWTATVTATDSAATPATGTGTGSVNILQETATSVTVTPNPLHAGGSAVLAGSLHVMQPVAGDGQEDGEMVPYAGKDLLLTWPDNTTGVTVRTNSAGSFSLHATLYTDGPVTLNFPGSTYRAASNATSASDIRVVANSTRIVEFNAGPEPVYRNGYITIVGRLERNDPDSSAWLSYGGKTLTIQRTGATTYSRDITTDSHGRFRLVLAGQHSTVAGTWSATFAGTPYNAPSVSRGDAVATMTAPMKITRVVFDPPGSDTPVTNTKVKHEVVRIANEGNQIANIFGWKVHDIAGHTYTVPHNEYIAPGHVVYLHTGVGNDTSTQLFWNLKNYVWNNGGDTAYLDNDRGALISTCGWTSDSGGGRMVCKS